MGRQEGLPPFLRRVLWSKEQRQGTRHRPYRAYPRLNMRYLHRAAAHSTGEDRMNSLVIAVIAIAVAQALMILLTIGREREIRKLRELVTQQRILISEINGWLMRERIELAQPRRIEPDREPIREPVADEIKAPKIKASEIKVPEPTSKDTTEDRLIKPDREPIADDMRVPEPAITKVPEPAKTLKDLLATVQPHTTEDETKEDATKRLTEATNWLKEDVGKARKIG